MEKIENIFRDLDYLAGGNTVLTPVEITVTLHAGALTSIEEYLREVISKQGIFHSKDFPVGINKELTVQTIYGTIKFISNGN